MARSVGNFKRDTFEVGEIVYFTQAIDEQVRWGNNDDPRKVLNMGQWYKIQQVEVHSWHTKLTLCGVDGKFNSVHFSKYGN